MIRDLVRYRPLIRNLVLKELTLKYRGSVLGVAWSLAHPALLLLVYTLAFRHVLRVPVPHYPFFLLVALLPWNFFATAASASTGSVVFNGSLLRIAAFPREALPVATVLFAFAQLLLALGVFLPAMAVVMGPGLSWTALLLLPLLLLHVVFTIGIALLLSALTTAWRDVAHFTEVALVLVFWLTPIVYPAEMVPASWRAALALSPPAAFAAAYQDVLFWGRLPAWTTAASAVISTMTAAVLGLVVFRTMSPAFVERV
jgi:ABC-type polysaccharide/polyol phosphate export permease